MSTKEHIMFDYINSNLDSILKWFEFISTIIGVSYLIYRWLKKTPNDTKVKIIEKIFGVIALLFLLLLVVSSIYLTNQITESRKYHTKLINEYELLDINIGKQKTHIIFIEKSKELQSSSNQLMTQLLQEERLTFLLLAVAFMFGAVQTLKMRKVELELQDRVTKLEKWVPSSELN